MQSRREHQLHLGEILVDLAVGEIAASVKESRTGRVSGEAAHVTTQLPEGDPSTCLKGVIDAELGEVVGDVVVERFQLSGVSQHELHDGGEDFGD